MGSKREAGVCNPNSKTEEEGSRKRRKKSVWQTFRIHSSEYVTELNRDERKKAAIQIDVTTSEREIKDKLMSELPRLSGKR